MTDDDLQEGQSWARLMLAWESVYGYGKALLSANCLSTCPDWECARFRSNSYGTKWHYAASNSGREEKAFCWTETTGAWPCWKMDWCRSPWTVSGHRTMKRTHVSWIERSILPRCPLEQEWRRQFCGFPPFSANSGSIYSVCGKMR